MTSKPDYKKLRQAVESNQDYNRRKSGELLEGQDLETTKFLRKNQSMSDLPLTLSKTPNPSPLLINQAAKPSFLATTQKLKKSHVNHRNQELPIDKIRFKIKKLFKDREQQENDEESLLDFNLKFNSLMLQLAQTVLIESNHFQPSQYESISALHLDHAFKQQVQAFQLFAQLKNERSILEQKLNLSLKKNELVLKENQRGTQEIADCRREKEQLLKDLQKQIIEKENLAGEVKKLKQTIDKLTVEKGKQNIEGSKQGGGDFSEECSELKYLIQGQFEAIQKLLQREQLVKVFLKKVGDNSILMMFEKFIQEAEQGDPNETEGNINANPILEKSIKLQEKEKEQSYSAQGLGAELLLGYEKSYKQVDLRDSQLADDSRVNDSEESSFRYQGKEDATEISQWIDTAPELKEKSKKKPAKLPRFLKEKLKINICEMGQINTKQGIQINNRTVSKKSGSSPKDGFNQ